ncbi:hypothetical protein HYS82_02455 [Candidatus Amesbacteria bacterium]|nr:hypothetical protein [Candidatus Amesbacteria bacterium]MBI2587188.1 hypothetical protein [Candidatus Amesbacteria bacterium]
MPDVYSARGEEKKEAESTGKFDPKLMIEQVLRKAGEVPGRAMMGAYNVKPGKRFMSEQEDEEVVLFLRAHPITNLRWILLAMVMIIGPEVLTAVGALADVPLKFVVMGKLVWYLVVLAYGLERFLNWYYSVFIVTNERVVDIDFVNLLTRVMSYVNLNHIEEPWMVAGGVFRSLFKYGDVFVPTAAEGQASEGRAIPYPDRVISIISELSEELEKRREKGE